MPFTVAIRYETCCFLALISNWLSVDLQELSYNLTYVHQSFAG